MEAKAAAAGLLAELRLFSPAEAASSPRVARRSRARGEAGWVCTESIFGPPGVLATSGWAVATKCLVCGRKAPVLIPRFWFRAAACVRPGSYVVCSRDGHRCLGALTSAALAEFANQHLGILPLLAPRGEDELPAFGLFAVLPAELRELIASLFVRAVSQRPE